MKNYQIFYMDNDRQKRIIKSGLTYWKAVSEAGRLETIYNTGIYYETIK